MLKFLLSLVGLAVGLISAELFLRNFSPAPNIYRFSLHGRKTSFQLSSNPILGYEMKPNYRDPEADCHNSLPETNSHGLRDRERTIRAAPGVRRVLLLGDSVVAGHGQCQFEEILGPRVEHLLRESNIEVLSFGIGGYCTRAEVELLEVKGLRFKPDLVILVFVANDYVSSNGLLLAALHRPPPGFAADLFDSSHLFRQLVLRTNVLGLKDQLDPAAPMQRNEAAIGDDNVVTGLARLAELKSEHGFEVLVTLWPHFSDTHIHEVGEMAFLGHRMNPGIHEFAKQHELKVFPLAPAFESDLAKYPKKKAARRKSPSPRWSYTQGDGTHPSKRGAEIAAVALSEEIKALLQREPSPIH